MCPSLHLETSCVGYHMIPAYQLLTSPKNSKCSVYIYFCVAVDLLYRAAVVATVKHTYLPYLACQFLTEGSIVAAGYDCYPVLWSFDDNNKLTFVNKLDQAEKKTGSGNLR